MHGAKSEFSALPLRGPSLPFRSSLPQPPPPVRSVPQRLLFRLRLKPQRSNEPACRPARFPLRSPHVLSREVFADCPRPARIIVVSPSYDSDVIRQPRRRKENWLSGQIGRSHV